MILQADEEFRRHWNHDVILRTFRFEFEYDFQLQFAGVTLSHHILISFLKLSSYTGKQHEDVWSLETSFTV